MPGPRITWECMRSPAFWSVILISVAYWCASFLIEASVLIKLLDGIVISLSLAVFVAYSGRFAEGLCHKRATASDLVIVGISLGWFVQGAERLWRIVSRVGDFPWMIDHYMIGFFLTLMAISASMHLMVKGAVQGRELIGASPRAWSSIVVATIFGFSLGAAAVTIARSLGR